MRSVQLQSTGEPQTSLLRVRRWELYPWLRAGFSTRLGGLSHVYGDREQNLGWTAEDDPTIVAANRSAFVTALCGGPPLPLVTVSQVHGAIVRDLEHETSPFMTPDGRARLEGDGMISQTPGRLLAILTADCVPVLLADTRTHAVGAFHAGWRGTLARIVERGAAEMRASYGTRAEDLIAAIGPCIQACCFEVGDEIRTAFSREFRYAPELFSPPGSPALHMDLAEANRRQLLQAGVQPENIRVLAHCTACSRLPDGRRRFFSYRAEGGRTGRMLSGIAAVG